MTQVTRFPPPRWPAATLLAMLGTAAAEIPAAAQVPDTAVAVNALSLFAATCESQGQALWNHSLCGPIILVHAPSRAAITNAPAPGGTFHRHGDYWLGELPAGLPTANTALQWGDTRWTMVLLPLPADEFTRMALLAHEAFHRV